MEDSSSLRDRQNQYAHVGQVQLISPPLELSVAPIIKWRFSRRLSLYTELPSVSLHDERPLSRRCENGRLSGDLHGHGNQYPVPHDLLLEAPQKTGSSAPPLFDLPLEPGALRLFTICDPLRRADHPRQPVRALHRPRRRRVADTRRRVQTQCQEQRALFVLVVATVQCDICQLLGEAIHGGPGGEYQAIQYYLCVMFGIAACGILDYSDIVREYLELVPFPSETFQYQCIGLLVADLALCWVIEKTIKRAYLKTFE